MELRSQAFPADTLEEAVELCYARGWTDGLPVVPPTLPAIERVIQYLGRDPAQVIGLVPPKNRVATIEKVAINCVMAGCLPEYVPVVLAALDAMLQESFNLNGVQTTTHCCWPLVIASGPIVERLGFNTRDAALAGCARANATIGRAVRLILWNLGGGYPGDPCKTTLGHPGYYSYCIAEDPTTNPWAPLHVERGFAPDDSCVTVAAVEAPHHIATSAGHATPEQMLRILSDSLSTIGSNWIRQAGYGVLILGPLAAQTLARGGYSKDDLRRHLMKTSGKPVKVVRSIPNLVDESHPGHWARLADRGNDEALLVPAIPTPESLVITVTGGWGGLAGFSAVCPGWGVPGGHPHTRRILIPPSKEGH